MLTETTLGYMRVLYDHIVRHGIPAALYSDKHSIFPSMPRRLIRRLRPSSHGRHVSWGSNVSTPIAHKPRGV